MVPGAKGAPTTVFIAFEYPASRGVEYGEPESRNLLRFGLDITGNVIFMYLRLLIELSIASYWRYTRWRRNQGHFKKPNRLIFYESIV